MTKNKIVAMSLGGKFLQSGRWVSTFAEADQFTSLDAAIVAVAPHLDALGDVGVALVVHTGRQALQTLAVL